MVRCVVMGKLFLVQYLPGTQLGAPGIKPITTDNSVTDAHETGTYQNNYLGGRDST